MTDDPYKIDKQELWDLIGNPWVKADRPEVDEWVTTTINRHRAQAAAIEHNKIMGFRSTWWQINWPVVLFASLWAVGMLVIGLVNGWS